MNKTRLGLYEKSMPENLSLLEKLQLAAMTGYDYVELSIDESDKKLARLDWKSEEIFDLKQSMFYTGIRFESICLSGHRKYPMGSREKEVRKKSLSIMQRAVTLAAQLGVRIIQLAGYDVYYEQGGEDTRELFLHSLRKSVDMASIEGVILAFETMETPFMNTVNKAMTYVREINSPYLQVYPDIGNVRNATKDYIADLECGKGHIVAAHLKETKEGLYRDVVYGEGRVDFDGCIAQLKSQGVGMFVSEFWYDGVTNPLEYLKKNKYFFENKL